MHSEDIFHHRLLVLFIGISFFLLFFSVSPYLFYDSMRDWVTGFSVQLMSFVCHQNLQRTFFVDGMPAAVCGRCLGIYSGLFAGFFSYFWRNKFACYLRNATFFLSLTSLVIVVDALSQWLELWSGSNNQRFATGIFFGISLSFYLVALLSKQK